MARTLSMAAITGTLALTAPLMAQHGRDTVLTDLGTLGGSTSRAFAINDSGYVTGGADLEDGVWHTFASCGCQMLDLGSLDGYRYSFGNDINNKGQIVGQSYYLYDGEATVWSFCHIESLGLYGNNPRSEARAINNDGNIVGYAWDDREYAFATPLLWAGGQAVDLGTLDEHTGGRAQDINNKGTIIGVCWDESQTVTTAWIKTRDGLMTALRGLGGSEAAADAINDRGDVVGSVHDAQQVEYPVLWHNGVLVLLETIEGRDARATGINNNEMIVGYVLAEDGFHSSAALWRFGSLSILNEMLPPDLRDEWDLVSAYDINIHGEIVGVGYHNGELHAYVLDVNQLNSQTKRITTSN
ncbi:MAG: hypothetical protein HND57_14075 [Planctomycetes bacterium]|nr:hypothetical protein [Planctomycetota bacterium]